MRAAFTTWQNRIAPVFDVARELHIVETKDRRVTAESDATFTNDMGLNKAGFLNTLGVETLICGAISRPMLEILQAQGIRVLPFVAGALHEVMDAWLTSGLDQERFAMPGCRGRARRQDDAKIRQADQADAVRRPYT